MVVGVCSGLSVCLAVPSVLVAGSDVVSGVVVIADREVECVCAGATLLVGVIEGVGASGSVRVVGSSIGVAGILEESLVSAEVDSQV